MSQSTILVVEDDPDIAELVEYNLSREGFRVVAADSGERGLRIALGDRPALVLLDLMLPGMSGFEFCRQLRRRKEGADIPVIMVTARGEEPDVVAGLELGADDYITKPFSVRELVARVNAVLRRAATVAPDDTALIRRGPVEIDPVRHEVRVDDRPVDLTLAEFRILEALASHPGRVFTRSRLVARITAGDHHISDRNADVHVAALRRKLGDTGSMIATVRGVGYKFRE